jgi:hypothetical protein
MKHLFFLFTVLLVACNSQPSKQMSDTTNYDSTNVKKSESVERTGFCNQFAEEILKSSPRYKNLTDGLLQAVRQNGGTSVSIVIEKSPDTTNNKSYEYSANYEMRLAENYPDRQVSIARFVFDPASKELYEYDVIADTLNSIPFEAKLLDDPQKYCRED